MSSSKALAQSTSLRGGKADCAEVSIDAAVHAAYVRVQFSNEALRRGSKALIESVGFHVLAGVLTLSDQTLVGKVIVVGDCVSRDVQGQQDKYCDQARPVFTVHAMYQYWR